ncbi:DUF5718 family protein [Vibrio olivae]|uniref:DUF5718 family protein n=1 Tax=Vibrio olivae TaxID=1243002 RepID=A0ABV5HI04_9VIBR
MKMYTDVLVLGIAGNFAGHLQQAGEAEDFAQLEGADLAKPQALFPIYVPSESNSFLTNFPLSHNAIQLPLDVDHLQIEPEVGLLCDVVYDQYHQVVDLKPKAFGAFNDCSIRRPDANKISEKKNWGTASKGIAETLLPISQLAPGGEIDQYRIASFHKRGEGFELYGEDCEISGYTYFYDQLLSWISEQMNQQQDSGPKENIKHMIAEADYPQQVLLALGATRYTPYGETNFLQRGDVSMVVVYDQRSYTPQQIRQLAASNQLQKSGISAVVQTVF